MRDKGRCDILTHPKYKRWTLHWKDQLKLWHIAEFYFGSDFLMGIVILWLFVFYL